MSHRTREDARRQMRISVRVSLFAQTDFKLHLIIIICIINYCLILCECTRFLMSIVVAWGRPLHANYFGSCMVAVIAQGGALYTLNVYSMKKRQGSNCEHQV